MHKLIGNHSNSSVYDMVSESGKVINEAGRSSRARLNRNIDGVCEEKLRSLKASNSAYRGAFTRIQNRVEQLMSEGGSYEEIQVAKASLDRTFISYSKCCQDIKDRLYEDELTELGDIVNEYTNVCKAKESLDRKPGEWTINAGDDLNVDFKERLELSELMTSRMKEHEMLTTSNEFAYPDMQRYDNRGLNISSGGNQRRIAFRPVWRNCNITSQEMRWPKL